MHSRGTCRNWRGCGAQSCWVLCWTLQKVAGSSGTVSGMGHASKALARLGTRLRRVPRRTNLLFGSNATGVFGPLSQLNSLTTCWVDGCNATGAFGPPCELNSLTTCWIDGCNATGAFGPLCELYSLTTSLVDGATQQGPSAPYLSCTAWAVVGWKANRAFGPFFPFFIIFLGKFLIQKLLFLKNHNSTLIGPIHMFNSLKFL